MNAADVAVAQAYDGLRRIQIASAANGAPAVDSADLVARALAVLDQDKMGGDV
ncbi:MAG: hypothetical protein JO136_23225, partial [Hyphomicrobiales bacterium]|nr:hypothetical protein [Hyphomicrobiales bacterium]